jgi:hypothetical protein
MRAKEIFTLLLCGLGWLVSHGFLITLWRHHTSEAAPPA